MARRVAELPPLKPHNATRVADLEKRVAELEKIVKELHERERVLHQAAVVDAPTYTAALKTPRECPRCNTMPDARGECLCYESMY